MKIIEGKFAGKQIQYKEQKGTRVTSEKVRKAVFDVLKNIINIEGAKIADIFCGSGMYGMEALSREACSVLFVDNNSGVVKLLQNNLAQLKVESYKVIKLDFEKFVKTCDEKFDLVFADPPYYEFDFDKFNEIYKILNKDGVFVLECSKRIKIGELQGLELVVEKKYGDTVVRFYRKISNI